MIKLTRQHKSPWINASKTNLVRDEFQLAKENLPGGYFQPLQVYKAIHQLGGEDLLYRGLAKLAPLSPLVSYHGDVSVWLSPPLSGMGNTVFIVMGRDSKGKLRLVGGNWYSEPKQRTGTNLTSVEFFESLDGKTPDEQRKLVKDMIEFSIQEADEGYLNNLDSYCEYFNTMPIYLVLLDSKTSDALFQGFPAVVQGDRPSDMSQEYFGEIL